MPWILGFLGASSVLLLGYPELPFSRSWNLILGHMLSACIGMVFLKYVGPYWWSIGLAVGTSLIFMMATKSAHPPAGSNPVIIFLSRPDWSFLIFPTLAGVLSLWLIALIYNRFARPRHQ